MKLIPYSEFLRLLWQLYVLNVNKIILMIVVIGVSSGPPNLSSS